MINLIARITAKSGAENQVEAVLTDYGTFVRSQPGTERFELYRDAEHSAEFVVVERYSTREAFDEHLADPENATINARLSELTEGGSSLQFLDAR